jgi:hypothetical protein
MKITLNCSLFLEEVFSKVNHQPRVTQQIKTQRSNSRDDEEKNYPQGNLENPNKLTVKKKRTNSQQSRNKRT